MSIGSTRSILNPPFFVLDMENAVAYPFGSDAVSSNPMLRNVAATLIWSIVSETRFLASDG